MCAGRPNLDRAPSGQGRLTLVMLHSRRGCRRLLRAPAGRLRALGVTRRGRLPKDALALACALAAAFLLGPRASAAPEASPQGVRIEGEVLDELGAPVAGAQVSLLIKASVVAHTATGEDGRFFLDAAAATEGTLVFSARGFAEVRREWGAAGGDGKGLRIVLAPAPLAEQVVVSATRTEARLGDTAASVTLVSAEELGAAAAVRLDDALRQVPGFQLFRRSGSRTANPTAQGVSLRGTGASGASRALVLLDGLPLNDPFGAWVYWGRVPRASISRVEILRGGASHLYGGGALGGVVNVLTRSPSRPYLSLEMSYGNQRTPDATLFAGGSRGKWAASLSAEIFRTGGYVIVDERERGRVDTPAGARHAALALTLERRVAGAGRLFARGELFGESRANGTPVQTNRTHLRQLSAGGDLPTRRLGSFSLRAYGGTQVFDQNFTAVAAGREGETLTRVQRVPSQFLGLTLQWSRAVGARQTLVAGLEAREVRGASDELVFVQGRPSSLVGAGGRERTVGLFVEDIVRPTPRLFLTGGVRVDRWREFAAQSATRPVRPTAAATVNVFADRTETALSPRLSVLYKPGEQVSFSLAAYRAFRQPSLNELYRSFRVGDVLTLSNENLRAERMAGGEAGASVGAWDGKLNVRATLFWADITRPVANITLNVAPTLITRQRQNLGRTRSRGLELDAGARLDERWSVTGGYQFVDARVRSFPANAALEGLLIPQVARHQLTFQVRYTNPSRLTIGLQGRAAGGQFDDDQNLFRLERFFTLDALASRRVAGGVEIFVAGENLFNRRYALGRTPVTTVGPPLLIRLGLRLRFGAPR